MLKDIKISLSWSVKGFPGFTKGYLLCSYNVYAEREQLLSSDEINKLHRQVAEYAYQTQEEWEFDDMSVVIGKFLEKIGCKNIKSDQYIPVPEDFTKGSPPDKFFQD